MIFAAGTGNPFFTTDTAAALRALEIGAEAILMAKNGVEGVYDGDPRVDPNAEFLPELTHLQAIERGLKVMDTTALSLCMDNRLPIHVFELAAGNIARVVAGERRRHDHLDPDRRRTERHGTIDDFIQRRDEAHGQVGRGDARALQLGPDGARVRGAPRPHHGRLLRHADAAQAAWRRSTCPEPRMLTIQPFDPSSIKEIERAIMESDLGLTPSNDGKLIRLPIPQLTEERRKELVKVVRQHGRGGPGRRAQRPPRRDAAPRGARPQRRRRRRRGARAPRRACRS